MPVVFFRRRLRRAALVACALAVHSAAAAAQRPWGPPPDSTVTAFVGVTVVPMDRERTIADQTVVVANGRIREIGARARVRVPSGARVIDGSGQFLMPGLADMHAHFAPYDPASPGRVPAMLDLLIAHGVTTARSMVGHASHPRLRESLAQGTLRGPHLVLAAPQIAGPSAGGPFAQYAVRSQEEAEEKVRQAKEQGFDFMKLTIALTPDVVEWTAAAAARAGLPVAGHVSSAVGLDRAIRLGMQIEHLDGYLEAVVPDTAPVRTIQFQTQPGPIVRHVDARRMREVAERTRRAGITNTPTLALFHHVFSIGTPVDSLMAWEEIAWYTPAARDALRQSRTAYWQSTTVPPEERELFDRFRRDMTRALADAGARLMLGSDSSQQGLMLGFSAHRELRALVDAGLTPYQALVAATRAPAEYLGAAREFGTVAPGLRADLVLLPGNPLQSVAVAKRPAGVMVHGRWYPRAALDSLLEGARP